MCSLQFTLLENALEKLDLLFATPIFPIVNQKFLTMCFFPTPQQPIKKRRGETTLTPSFRLPPASQEAVSQSNEKSSMASVTNLKLRDGVGTVVPVEAFPTLKMDGKFQRCINSWIKIGDSYMFCYMLPCDKSTTSGDFICTNLQGHSTLLHGFQLACQVFHVKMNGFPSGEARHLVGIRENGDDAWHHLRLVGTSSHDLQGILCIQQVVWIAGFLNQVQVSF